MPGKGMSFAGKQWDWHMKEYSAMVLENRPIAANVQSLTFSVGGEVRVRAGQFVNISVGDGLYLLRRPIAVCKAEGGRVTVCFQLKGEGTRHLAAVREGETLRAVLPLGNGFAVGESQKRVALVGGGVGVFPMVSAVREFVPAGKEVSAYMGFRNRDAVCCLDELNRAKETVIVTDDGSFGEKMNAVQAFAKSLEVSRPDIVLSCGPLPMLKALKEAVKNTGIPCYVSLEERMGCGIGACLVCVCDRADGSRARVCRDGPVFEIGSVRL